ncbi:MAG: oxidoreductase domain protein [Rhodocyclales bacterium]|nr:oxidoreductase domain protein [Rhodocyclales bacterium]MDB5889107.1 oxidoreductase domain protein [Rhodocyclales bacterium]
MHADTIRWGIIGCGDVTEVKSGPGFQKAEGSQLVAVMRRNGALAADYARRHGVPKWYDDADALIADPEVDAIYIATPPSTHKDYVLRCAAAGKPVLVEKPMAMNHAECLTMNAACNDAGIALFVAYYRRTLPRYLKIKSLIDSGAIGEVRMVSTRFHRPSLERDKDPSQFWRIDPALAGGGYFVDLAGHALDFLDYLLGPITQVSGYATNQAGLYAAEDIVSGSFRFASGVQGTGQWCFSVAEQLDLTEITGTRGSVRFGFYDSQVQLHANGNIESFAFDNPPHVHLPLIQTVVDALRGKGICPSDGTSGARTAWVMDGLLGRA